MPPVSSGWPSVKVTVLDVLSDVVQRIPIPLREWAVRLALIAGVLVVLMQLGLDLRFMWEWTFFLVSMTPLVLYIALAALALAIPCAVLLTAGRLSNSALIRAAAGLYVSLVRGVPLIVLLFFFFLALPQIGSLGPDWLYTVSVLSPTTTAVLAIGLFHAAYISELFRAGFLSVPVGQWEAAASIGMTTRQTTRRIIWPQAIQFAIRPTTNHFIMMLKDTALVGFLGVPVLFQRADRIGSQNLKMFETILIAALIYWLLTVLSWKVIDWLDRRALAR